MSQGVKYKTNEFKDFVNGLAHYQKSNQMFPRFKTAGTTFLEKLQPPKQTSASQGPFVAFSKKYHVTLPADNQSLEGMIAYTSVFRAMFPALKVESQSFTFQTKNAKENPFAVQWGLIGQYIEGHSQDLATKLDDLFAQGTDFQKLSTPIKALLDAGAPVTHDAARHALLCDDPRFFELLTSRGCYKPTSFDLTLLINLGDAEKQTKKAKMLIEAGIPITSQVASKTLVMKDLKFYELLLSYQYKPSHEDIKLISNMDSKAGISFLELLKANGYVFTDMDCLSVLSAYLFIRNHSRKDPLTKLDPKLAENLKALIQQRPEITDESLECAQKLIQLVCPNQQLSSPLFRKVFQHAYVFLGLGYQPTTEDLRFAVSKGHLYFVDAIAESKVTDFDKMSCYLFCYDLNSEFRKKIFSYSIRRQEVVRAVLAHKTENYQNYMEKILQLLIRDNHNYSNPIRNRASGHYEVEFDDLIYAVDQKVNGSIFDMLLVCWSYHPAKKLFHKILSVHPSSSYIRSMLQEGYRIDSEDFKYACNIKCSNETISMLLNYGTIKREHEVYYDYQWSAGYNHVYLVFEPENAGYIPFQEDLDLVKSQGYGPEVQELVSKHMLRDRRRYRIFTNNYRQDIKIYED